MTQAFYGNPWAVKPWARFYGSGGMYVPMPQATRANGYAWLAPSGYQFSGLGGASVAAPIDWAVPVGTAIARVPRDQVRDAAVFASLVSNALKSDPAGVLRLDSSRLEVSGLLLTIAVVKPTTAIKAQSTLDKAILAAGPMLRLTGLSAPTWPATWPHIQSPPAIAVPPAPSFADEYGPPGPGSGWPPSASPPPSTGWNPPRWMHWLGEGGIPLGHEWHIPRIGVGLIALAAAYGIYRYMKKKTPNKRRNPFVLYKRPEHKWMGEAATLEGARSLASGPGSYIVADEQWHRQTLVDEFEKNGRRRNGRRKNRSHRDLYTPQALVARAHRAGVAAKTAGRGHDVWSAWANMGSDLGKVPAAFHTAYDAGYFGGK